MTTLMFEIAGVLLFAYSLRDLVQIVRKGDIKATEAQL